MYDAIGLRQIGRLVHEILKEHKDARSSDSVLYFKVLEVYGNRKGIDIHSMPIPRFFLEMMGEFPNYESVRRARQKIQAAHPELSANETVKEFRDENRRAFFEYAVTEDE